jgi:hypothetical protein
MAVRLPRGMTKCSPFRHFKTSPEIIRIAVMLYIRFPLSLRNVELKLGPAANAIERREQFAAEAGGRDYEPLTRRGTRLHAVLQSKTMFAAMRERLELVRDASAKGRKDGHGHVSVAIVALRAVVGRKAQEPDQEAIKQRLARIAGRDLGADQSALDARADTIRDRLKQVIGRDKPDPHHQQQRNLEEEHEKAAPT